jgi:hypothetical protein
VGNNLYFIDDDTCRWNARLSLIDVLPRGGHHGQNGITQTVVVGLKTISSEAAAADATIPENRERRDG